MKDWPNGNVLNHKTLKLHSDRLQSLKEKFASDDWLSIDVFIKYLYSETERLIQPSIEIINSNRVNQAHKIAFSPINCLIAQVENINEENQQRSEHHLETSKKKTITNKNDINTSKSQFNTSIYDRFPSSFNNSN